MPATHYDTLQVARQASPEVVRAAYKSLTQRYHPDRHPPGERAVWERRMQALNAAYAVLSDPEKRSAYDDLLTASEPFMQYAGADGSSTAWSGEGSAPERQGDAPIVRESSFTTEPDESAPMFDRPSSALASKPMSAWTGMGIAVLAVVAIMAAMSLRDTRGGRVLVAVGGVALVLLCLFALYRRVRTSPGTGRDGANGISWWVTALVWGWLALAIMPHDLGSLGWPDYASFAAVFAGAWVPLNAAHRVLLAPDTSSDLTWKRVGGLLFLMVAVLVGTAFATHHGANGMFPHPTDAAHGGGKGLAAAHVVGVVIGMLLSACVVTALLVGVGAAGSVIVGTLCNHFSRPSPRVRLTTLMVGWAAIPVLGMFVLLLNWVP